MPELVQANVSGGAPPLPPWFERFMWEADEQYDREMQVILRDPKGEAFFKSNAGPQTWAYYCPYREMLTGGRRGGGKSVWARAWMVAGDPSLPPDDPARYSFVNDPGYRGLILRKEYQSLAEFIDEAAVFYKPFGVKVTGGSSQPVVFEFKSGAKIYTNHLNSEEAYEKYRGWSITRICIEELTQIPTQRQYLKLLGSLRSAERRRNGKTYPPLRIQIAGTTNPDGVGREWVKARFVRVMRQDDTPFPWNTPIQDRISKGTRIFIPFPIEANPYYAEGTAAGDAYRSNLMAQDEVTRAQWMDGDWDAGSGVFFSEYRPDGPRGQEEADKYPAARHRTDPVPLQPWWYRWMSLDWGWDHPAVAHKYVRNERDKRIHVYDELSVRQVGSYELGVLLAQWALPELEQLPEHQMTIYMSPDAFAKTDATRTKAEQIADGIKEVIGPYGALLMRYTDDERQAATKNPKYAAQLFESRRNASQGKMCLILKPANTDRIAGWSYMHELLRFRPILNLAQEQIQERLQKSFDTHGLEAYERDADNFRRLSEPEVLPKLLIWKNCVGLDRCLREAQHDEPPRSEDVRKWDAVDGVGGDDPIDSGRMGLIAYKEIQTQIPKSYWVADRVAEIQAGHKEAFGEELTDPTRLAMISAAQNFRFEKQHAPVSGGFTLPRQGAQRHRVQ